MIAFSLGSLHVYRYGIFYLITCFIGYVFLYVAGKSKYFGAFPGVQRLLTTGLDDMMIAIVAGIIIGGRLGHVAIYNASYYLHHLSEIFRLQQGGMSFIGGIIGVVIAMLIIKRRYRISLRDLAVLFDLVLLIVPIGIFLGRIGNFLNQELYGTIVPANMLWVQKSFWGGLLTHVYPLVDTQLRRNTNYMAAGLEGVVIGIVLWSIAYRQWRRGEKKGGEKKHRTPGRISAVFLVMYCVVRFGLEYLRADSQGEYVGWFTVSQWRMVGILVSIAVYATQNTLTWGLKRI